MREIKDVYGWDEGYLWGLKTISLEKLFVKGCVPYIYGCDEGGCLWVGVTIYNLYVLVCWVN
jgi:hypothetical protein